MAAKLLLADDSVTIQRVIELTFSDEDVDVIAVGDGEAAIARLEADPPDVVLADVGMPGRDGYEVAEYVQAHPRLSHIPVLLLTGAFDPVDELRAREAGCAGVLVKPFEPQMVIARVRQLLAGGRAAGAAAVASSTPPDGAASSPTDALLAAPPNIDAGASGRGVDDYFDRLDAAFANLAGADTTTPRAGTSDAAPIQPAQDAPAPALSVTAPAPHPATQPPTQPDVGVSMADAFAALLAVEQGEPAPALALGGLMPPVSDDLVEAVTRRVAAEVAERVVRDIAPDMVSRIAEKLVRDEIERLKALPR